MTAKEKLHEEMLFLDGVQKLVNRMSEVDTHIWLHECIQFLRHERCDFVIVSSRTRTGDGLYVNVDNGNDQHADTLNEAMFKALKDCLR